MCHVQVAMFAADINNSIYNQGARSAVACRSLGLSQRYMMPLLLLLCFLSSAATGSRRLMVSIATSRLLPLLIVTGSGLITVTTVGRCHKYTGIWHLVWRDGKERRKPKNNVSASPSRNKPGYVSPSIERCSLRIRTGTSRLWRCDRPGLGFGRAGRWSKGKKRDPSRAGRVHVRIFSSSVASLFPLVR